MSAPRRHLSDAERALLTHVSRWGSDGYPVVRLGRKWAIDTPATRIPTCFKTKREAVAAFERYLDVLIAARGVEAHRSALRDARARALAAGDTAAVAEWGAKLAAELRDDLDEALRYDTVLATKVAAELAELGWSREWVPNGRGGLSLEWVVA